MASALSDHENNALWAGYLLAVPPPAPGTQPLAGSTTVDLPGNSLTQWATHIQYVASGMRLPPEAVVNCPHADFVGVLNRLERMTMVRYCHLCFGVGQKCGCSSVPHQTPSQASALWMPPTTSYVAMASSTKTTASSSVAGVPPPRYPPPGLPPLEPMDTLLAPTSKNLLATAGVGRGGRGQSQPSTPTAPGVRQTRPTAHNSGCPPLEGRRQTRQLLTGSRCTHLDAPLGYKRSPPSQAPPLAPVRVARRQPGRAKMPEVGPHPEGLKANTREIDPPPEDLGNADEASIATTLWMKYLTTWPQDGNETSRT